MKLQLNTNRGSYSNVYVNSVRETMAKKKKRKKQLTAEQSRGIFLTDGLWMCERETAERVAGLLAVSGDFG